MGGTERDPLDAWIAGKCCVPGCLAIAPHERTFTVGSDGWGEAETTAAFCCEHFDMLLLRPSFHLRVIGVVSEAASPGGAPS